jgi:uncharacterized protein
MVTANWSFTERKKMKKMVMLFGLLVSLVVVQAQTPDKGKHYRAAEELLLTMNMKQVIGESLDQLLALQIKNNPSLQPAEATLKQFFNKYMSWEALREDYIKIYMEEFTEKELKDMMSFYKTDTGKKMAAKQSTLMLKGAQLGQSKVQEHMSELQEMLQKLDK